MQTTGNPLRPVVITILAALLAQPVHAGTIRFEFSGTWAQLNCQDAVGICALVGTDFTGFAEIPSTGTDSSPENPSLGSYEFQPNESAFLLDTADDRYDVDLQQVLRVVVLNNGPGGYFLGLLAPVTGDVEVVLFADIPPDIPMDSDHIPSVAQLSTGYLGLRMADYAEELPLEDVVRATQTRGNLAVDVSLVPVPAAGWLFVSGALAVLAGCRRRPNPVRAVRSPRES